MKRILMLLFFLTDPTLFSAGSNFEVSFPVDTSILSVRSFLYREAKTLAFRIQNQLAQSLPIFSLYPIRLAQPACDLACR